MLMTWSAYAMTDRTIVKHEEVLKATCVFMDLMGNAHAGFSRTSVGIPPNRL